MQFPNLGSMHRRGRRPAETLPDLPRMRQTSPRSLSQNLSFELGENGEQARHGASGWRGQVQCLSQRNEPDTQVLQFLECG